MTSIRNPSSSAKNCWPGWKCVRRPRRRPRAGHWS